MEVTFNIGSLKAPFRFISLTDCLDFFWFIYISSFWKQSDLSTQTNSVQFNSLPVMPMAMHCAMFTLKINLFCKTFFFFLDNAWNPLLPWQLSLVEMMCHRKTILACFKSYTALSKQNFILQGEPNKKHVNITCPVFMMGLSRSLNTCF